VWVRLHSYDFYCVLLYFFTYYVCLSVCMSVCVCVWAMLPDSNKMMMMMIFSKLGPRSPSPSHDQTFWFSLNSRILVWTSIWKPQFRCRPVSRQKYWSVSVLVSRIWSRFRRFGLLTSPILPSTSARHTHAIFKSRSPSATQITVHKANVNQNTPRVWLTRCVTGNIASAPFQWRSNGAGKVQGPQVTGKFFWNNFPAAVKIRTSGYQTLECFIATLPTQVYILILQYNHRFADFCLWIAQKCVWRPGSVRTRCGGWKGEGGKGKGGSGRERRLRKERECSTWIFVQRPRVPSYATVPFPCDSQTDRRRDMRPQNIAR